MEIQVTAGDILAQPVEAIVNPWNQNILPWWLLMPSGVSGAIKRTGGTQPFRELRQKGRLPSGGAVTTSAGELPYTAIIHVASIAWWGRSSIAIIQASVANAVRTAQQIPISSLAFPILGAGAGGVPRPRAEAAMLQTLETFPSEESMHIIVVRPQ
jgi:O-acetyl-ADP-ribose deacetylase (regulator of RNase III)